MLYYTYRANSLCILLSFVNVMNMTALFASSVTKPSLSFRSAANTSLPSEHDPRGPPLEQPGAS